MSTKLLDERIVPILPSVAVQLGLNEAIVMQQLHYVLQRENIEERDGRRAVRMTYEEWVRHLPWWSESTIRRTFDALRQSGLVITQRSKDSTWFSIDYVRLDLRLGTVNSSQVRPQTAEPSAQVERDPCKKNGEEETEEEHLAAGGRLFGGDDPAEAVQEEERQVQDVWDYYMAHFGDARRVKTLTPQRIGMIRRGLAAVGGDASVLKRAFDGLKSYREAHPHGSQDTSIDTVLKTRPGGSNLTDQIEFWIGQATATASVDASISPVWRDVVTEKKNAVREWQMYHILRPPVSEHYAEQGRRAAAYLEDNFGITYEVDDQARITWSAPTKLPEKRT